MTACRAVTLGSCDMIVDVIGSFSLHADSVHEKSKPEPFVAQKRVDQPTSSKRHIYHSRNINRNITCCRFRSKQIAERAQLLSILGRVCVLLRLSNARSSEAYTTLCTGQAGTISRAAPMASASVCFLLIVFHLTFLCGILYLVPDAVPWSDTVFVFSSSTYAAFVNFIMLKEPTARRHSLGPTPAAARVLFPITAALSIFVPYWMLFGDPIFRRQSSLLSTDGTASPLAKMLIPHLFLTHAQLAVETFSHLNAHIVTTYVRVSLPIAYVTYRLSVLAKWWSDANDVAIQTPFKYDQDLLRILAMTNAVFWTFGLFGFLIPFVVLRFFRVPTTDELKVESLSICSRYRTECSSEPDVADTLDISSSVQSRPAYVFSRREVS